MKQIDDDKIKLKNKKNLMEQLIIEDEFEDVSDSEEDIETENIDEFDFKNNEHNNICVNRHKPLFNINKEVNISKNNDIYIENLEINEEIVLLSIYNLLN